MASPKLGDTYGDIFFSYVLFKTSSQVGEMQKADVQKRMIITPLQPIGDGVAETSQIGVVSNKDGKKRMTVAPIEEGTCPPGCITELESQIRIRKALEQAGGKPPPKTTKGLQTFQDSIDRMEKHYSKMEELKKQSKKSKKSNKKEKKLSCSKYSKSPLKCIARGCKYNKKTKQCYGEIPKHSKPKKKRKAVVHDDDEESATPFILPKKAPSPKKGPSSPKYKNARAAAVARDALQFEVDGNTFRRKSISSPRFMSM
jgi:hypothetical protein